MIEFKKDGICDDAGRNEPLRTLVIGIGAAGVNIVDQVVIHGGEGIEVLALDSDQVVVEGSVASEKALLGSSLTRGLGCAGDLDRARDLWKLESGRLLPLLSGYRQVVVVAGLGGATGSVFALEIAKAVRRRSASEATRVVAVAGLPFTFESEGRKAHARRILGELRSHCDAVLSLGNDRVDAWEEAKQNVRHGLHGLNLELARAVEAATQIMSEGGMNPVTFADLRSLFGRFGGAEVPENCWIGRAGIHAEEGPARLVDLALESPLLSSAEGALEADSCVACVVGGHDFALGQLKAITEALKDRLPAGLPLMIGARTVDRHEGRIKLTLLLAATRAPERDQAEIHLPAAAEDVVVSPVVIPAFVPQEKRPEPVVEAVAEEGVEPAPEAIPVRRSRRGVEPVVEVAEAAELLPVPVAELPVRAEARPSRRAKPVKQEELPFEAGSRGRFENSLETIHNGENLDQPTFRRRRIAIKA